MAKICRSCHAENRNEAQFCKVCGTAFPIPAPPPASPAAAGLDCPDCGFANKPGVRYCAKCGVNLAAGASGSTAGSAAGDAAPAARPAAPGPSTPGPAASPDPRPGAAVPEASTPDAAARAAAAPATSIGFGEPPPPRPVNRTSLVAGVGIALLVAAVVAWWFLDSAPSKPAKPASTTAQPQVLPATPPAGVSPAAPAVVMPVAPAASAEAAATAADRAASTPPPGTEFIEPQQPAAATAVGSDEAQRLAAEKAARDKAARDRAARLKAERESAAKAAAEEREAAARLKAEQDAAAARKRAEAQRPAAPPPRAVAPAPRPAPVEQARTVRELCAGRNPISQSICESRACGAPEHANEPLCKQIRANEERRRDPT